MANRLIVHVEGAAPDIEIPATAPAPGDPLDPYTLMEGFGVGAVLWRRQSVISPFIPGRTLVDAVLDAQTMSVPVTIQATDPTAMRNRITSLIDAFSQFTYEVDYWHEPEGETPVQYSWLCECADYTTGPGKILGGAALGCASVYWQQIVFAVPRSPVALTGPL